jgi:hypothetical protein
MSTTNEIWLTVDGHRHRLDLDESTLLLPSFQANDRTRPESIQSNYSQEFSCPSTAKNMRLLRYAISSQATASQAYQRVPCVLTSGGVETLPLGILYIKGYSENRIQLQIFGGNKRLVEALGDKKLSDLDLSRFDHYWTPENILAGLPYDYWKANGYGYEVYDRGRELDLQAVNPYHLYPSCSNELVLQQILTDAGFKADSLLSEPLFAALNVPSANPYTFSAEFRKARQLKAGIVVPYTPGVPNRLPGIARQEEFAQEKLPFDYTVRKPYVRPTAGASYTGFTYVVDTLGYYNLTASVPVCFGSRKDALVFGEVSCKVLLRVNGKPVLDDNSQEIGKDELRNNDSNPDYQTHTFTPKLERYLLKPGDTVELYWQGDEWKHGATGAGPLDPYWQIGPASGINTTQVTPDQALVNQSQFAVELLEEFPEGGLVKLQDWLPDMKQLDYLKMNMLLGGLTIQCDPYEPYLKLSPGSKLLENIPKAKDWTRKRAAYAQPGRLPERALTFRFGSYAQTNLLKWAEDDNVTEGYGDGQLDVADEVLDAEYELATLPFAATEASPVLPAVLRILNFESDDLTAEPPTYNSVEAEPRLTLRAPGETLFGQLVMVPADPDKGTEAVLADFISSPSYFTSPVLSLDLNETVLTYYWQDLRAMLDQARYLTEQYRLTPQDIAELDFSVPIWDGGLGDFFCVSSVSEYDARRPVEVTLCRLNGTFLPIPAMPDLEAYHEFYPGEFVQTPREFY